MPRRIAYSKRENRRKKRQSTPDIGRREKRRDGIWNAGLGFFIHGPKRNLPKREGTVAKRTNLDP